jgi:uncharacterized protein (TIGR02678 family)
MSNLANQQVIAEKADISLAIRTLLATPLITQADAVTFDLIRRRKDLLFHWFNHNCGWTLLVEPRLGYARLVKVGTSADSSRPARRSRTSKAPFDRRRYTLLCSVAAELLSTPMTTIGALAEQLAHATHADPLLETFDTTKHAERVAYVDVLRLLEKYGAVEAVDGSTDAFTQSEYAQVLYRVDAARLMRLLAASVGPSQISIPTTEVPDRFDEALAAISVERRYGDGESDIQRNLRLRHTIFRRLFDDPVLYFDELSDDQLAYLKSLTGRKLMTAAVEQAGMHLEERADGIMLVDTDAIATDTKFPDDASSAKIMALHLLDALVESPNGITVEQLRLHASKFLHDHPKWAKTYHGNDGASNLVVESLVVLTNFSLVRLHNNLYYPKPAAFRYKADAFTTAEAAAS